MNLYWLLCVGWARACVRLSDFGRVLRRFMTPAGALPWKIESDFVLVTPDYTYEVFLGRPIALAATEFVLYKFCMWPKCAFDGGNMGLALIAPEAEELKKPYAAPEFAAELVLLKNVFLPPKELDFENLSATCFCCFPKLAELSIFPSRKPPGPELDVCFSAWPFSSTTYLNPLPCIPATPGRLDFDFYLVFGFKLDNNSYSLMPFSSFWHDTNSISLKPVLLPLDYFIFFWKKI